MKTLSIQQPWASLICAGIKDVENRTWKPAENPGKILIHASSKTVTANFLNSLPMDWFMAVHSHMVYGNIPFFDEFPTSAIIGYVTVKGFEPGLTDSLWDGGEEQIKWILEDAYLFDEPILNVKGKLWLFDYPLDEDNLPPAHIVDLKLPSLEGTTLVVPVSDKEMSDYCKQAEPMAHFDMIDEMILTICDDKGYLKPIDAIRLESPTRILESPIADSDLLVNLDESGEPFKDTNLRGEEVEWVFWSGEMTDINVRER